MTSGSAVTAARARRELHAPLPPRTHAQLESERSPLLQHASRNSYNSVAPSSRRERQRGNGDTAVGASIAAGAESSGASVDHGNERRKQRRKEDLEALPKWFVGLVCASVTFTLTWMCGLVVLQHTRRRVDVSEYVSVDTAHSLYLYAGVLNSMLGSFLSASGYCCQKWAHMRVQRAPALGTASQQRVFGLGLFLLAVGTLSAVMNLGLLGQAVQAPFAALTLIYSALLGHFVLCEDLLVSDVLSSVLIVLGVAVDVYAAQLSRVPQPSYTLQSLARLFFRDSVFPAGYALLVLAYIAGILRQVHTRRLQQRAVGLLAFSSCAGIMAGFTSLATKSVVEVTKSALRRPSWAVMLNPFFVLLVAAIPCALVPQLFFLNKGLECFGTLQFIPLYQAFIILGNLLCGLVFYNEMASYSLTSVLGFVAGITITLAGVCLLLVKADSAQLSSSRILDATSAGAVESSSSSFSSAAVLNGSTESALAPSTTTNGRTHLATEFAFEQMHWATGDDVTPLHDFDACKRTIVRLLSAATTSVYYSTFLCDFTLVLAHSDLDGEPITFLSLIQAAVQRGVRVHILYNPVGDYGTASVAALQQQLPPQVHLAYCVSDLGPSVVTQCFSSNSKYAFHHQKYLCVDGSEIMVTGCDVNAERAGWLRANALGYYWHELSVVCRCSARMFAWIERNHTASHGKRRHYDDFGDAAPFPLVSGGWREENAMVNMILHAEQSVQLENQILISGGALQHNRVCEALVTRIARAHRAHTPFHALVLTNAAQQDEPSRLTQLYCVLSIQWSLEQLEVRALEHGLTREQLAQYLVVARLEHRGVLVKVHSNILIIDGEYALRSSSNLADRSLSSRPTDTELGLLFAGASTVGALQQELLNMYLGTTHVQYSLADVFGHIHAGRSGCIVPLVKKAWSPVMTWFLMNVFIYGSEGATGGRRKVSFETSVVSLRSRKDVHRESAQTADCTSDAAVAC